MRRSQSGYSKAHGGNLVLFRQNTRVPTRARCTLTALTGGPLWTCEMMLMMMLMMLMIMMIVMMIMIMMGSRFPKSSLLLVACSHSFANFARSSSRDGADSIYYAFVTSAGSWGRSGRSHMSQVPSAFLKFLKYPCGHGTGGTIQ